MARVPMVTRTIVSTKAEVMVVNTETGETSKVSVTLPRTYKDVAGMLKVAKPMLETDTVKAVTVTSFEVEEKLYGMTEVDFVKTAKVLTKEEAEEAEETEAPAVETPAEAPAKAQKKEKVGK